MSERSEATHLVSVVAYQNGEIDLTFENLETRETAHLTILRDDTVGDQLAKAIGPCVYWPVKLEEPHE